MSSKEVGAIGSLGLRDSSQGLDTLYNQDVQSTNLAYENRRGSVPADGHDG